MADTPGRLDDAYENGAYIPGGADYPPRWAAAAEAFRAQADATLDQPYGDTPRQAMDLFRPEGAAKGLVVFVHGGYWRKFSRKDFSHLAAGPVARGWAVAMPSYDLCPAVRIGDITRQILRAVTAAATAVPGPVVIAGHSAGGHLSARMGCADLDLPIRERVKRIVPISPLSDLAPLRETSMNADLRIDAEEARTESPVHHPAPACPVTVWVGGAERPAFLDQARWLGEAWGCEVVVEPERHHFDVIEGLERPESPLTTALLDGI